MRKIQLVTTAILYIQPFCDCVQLQCVEDIACDYSYCTFSHFVTARSYSVWEIQLATTAIVHSAIL